MAAGQYAGTPGIAGSRGSFRFTWRGAEVQHALEDALQTAMQETAESAKSAAQERCPVDTGLLRDSIFADVNASGGSARRTLVIGADVPYAAYVELGTSRQSAQPFIRPAVDQEAPKLTERLRAAVQGLR